MSCALLDEHRGPAVLPTFALIANWWAVKDLRATLESRIVPDRALRAVPELERPVQLRAAR